MGFRALSLGFIGSEYEAVPEPPEICRTLTCCPGNHITYLGGPGRVGDTYELCKTRGPCIGIEQG